MAMPESAAPQAWTSFDAAANHRGRVTAQEITGGQLRSPAGNQPSRWSTPDVHPLWIYAGKW